MLRMTWWGKVSNVAPVEEGARIQTVSSHAIQCPAHSVLGFSRRHPEPRCPEHLR